jgi:hypothetical protein
MDNSDISTTSSSAQKERAKMARRQRARDTTDGDDGCNWDIEVLQFVVDSFIKMFPEREDERRGELITIDAGSIRHIAVLRLTAHTPRSIILTQLFAFGFQHPLRAGRVVLVSTISPIIVCLGTATCPETGALPVQPQAHERQG